MKSIIITVILTIFSIVVSKQKVETDTEKTTTKYLDACSKGKYCVESDSGPLSS